MHENLDVEVKALLEAKKGDWQAVADESGVSYSWLSKFVNGHIPNPGYATLKKLHTHLAALPSDPPAKPVGSAAPRRLRLRNPDRSNTVSERR